MADPQQKTIKSEIKDSLEGAMEDAHKKVEETDRGEWHRMRVYVRGDNPIRDYIVTLERGNP